MKRSVKGKATRGGKRDLFAELSERMTALADAQGQRNCELMPWNTNQHLSENLEILHTADSAAWGYLKSFLQSGPSCGANPTNGSW